MRILLDATTASPGVPGLTTYLQSLLTSWRQVGPEDEFLTLINRDAPEEVRRAGRKVGYVRAVGRRGVGYRLAVQQCLVPGLLRSYAPDVLLAAAPDMPVMASCGVPVVQVVHDLRHMSRPQEFSRPRAMYRQFAYAVSFRHAKRLIAISETTAAALRTVYPYTACKTVVVRHGADHVDPWPRVSKQKQALAFGQWSNKRPDLAVRVWADLRRAIPGFDWMLHIVGTRGDTTRALRSLTQRLRVSDIATIHAFLGPDSFHELFAASQLVLFPTTEEGFGLPIVEAMRLGIPVVASDIPASREVAAECALYAKVSSQEELVAACLQVITNAQLRKSLIQAGIVRSAEFTWRGTAEKTRAALMGHLR